MNAQASARSGAGFRAGLSGGFHNLTDRRPLAGFVATLVLVAFAALIEKRVDVIGAATRVLEDQVFGVILPFAILWLAKTALASRRLDDAAASFARFGVSRRAVAAGFIVASMFAAGALAALAGGIAALVAHDRTAPPLPIDTFASAWIGALTGAAYAAFFAFGGTFGARGGGRLWVLALDFVLGSSAGTAAILMPRAHALNLLGGQPPLGFSQITSAVVLVLLSGGFSLLALARLPP